MSRLLAVVLSLVFSLPAFAELPLPAGTSVSIETRSKTISGTLQSSSDPHWIRVLEPAASAPTLIPVAAIETVRQNAPLAEVVAAAALEEPGAGPQVHTLPLEIAVSMGEGEPAKALVTLKANEDIGETSLAITLLGVAEADDPDGFVRSAPRSKVLLGLPAVVSLIRELEPFTAGEERTVEVPIRLEPHTGRGGVIATVGEQLPAHGEPGSVGPGGVLETAYGVFMAEDGRIEAGSNFLDVEIERLRARGADAAADVGEELDDTIERLRRSGARSQKELKEPAPEGEPGAAAEGAAEAAATRVKGTVRFTDAAGGTHPVPFVKVELWDANSVQPHVKVAEGETDAAGNYTLTVGAGADELPDLYLIARATGVTAKIVDFNSGSVWAIDSLPPVNDVPAGSELQINLTADNDLITKPSNVAFEVYTAVDAMARYLPVIGEPLPRQVTIRYPRAGDGSDYLNNVIRLGGSDAHDWDNIHHEFGHHLQDIYDISDSPGGAHALSENLCDSHGKHSGIRLAWGEGWPTYFSLLMQAERALVSMHVPNLGDTRYTDTKPDGFKLEYDIESDADIGGAGEGNEIVVQRLLWDLYDAASVEQEQVAISAKDLFGVTVASHSVTFSSFWNAFVGSQPVNNGPEFGKLLATHKIAPAPQTPVEGFVYSGGPSPTFTWSGTTGCGLTPNTFEVIVFENDLATPRFVSPPLTTASFTPSETERLQIFGGPNVPLRWLVRARCTTSPTTGHYLGRPRAIVDNFDVQ